MMTTESTTDLEELRRRVRAATSVPEVRLVSRETLRRGLGGTELEAIAIEIGERLVAIALEESERTITDRYGPQDHRRGERSYD